MAELLITARVDPNVKNWVIGPYSLQLLSVPVDGQNNETPMQFATQNNHHDMIVLLKNHGCEEL